ncbi:testis-expressed protein 48 [Desmodus rotundus]|uniref:testis-expressed protein 48 n=1 Tax=Desmodus rotundus TaxID=9430 RepID=UPI0023812E97|nr:testis-expressed protein 48 [Desmodus rotundus]
MAATWLTGRSVCSVRTQDNVTIRDPAAHRKLALKIFCLCCRDCEEPHATEGSTSSSEIPEQQPGGRKLELDQQNPKYANGASRLALRQPLTHPEKDSSTSSSDFEECPPGGFCKRNLDRYPQNHWPFQPCLIGRP